ncbi:MAG TPA: tannase/feruloyl esterase family alpha/beta hydrolase [Xanthomonadales bacterium]|nr:tannase/feruloyl esterase family alpha/beta hydrolase [Xanthomonadales bacterium]
MNKAASAGNEAPAINCSALLGQQHENIRLDSAEVVSGRAGLPAFCAVRGTIEPTVGFEMRLPVEGWNGKLFQAGCGGYCGAVLPDKPGWSNTINGALQMGYAAITTDSGHQGGLGDASWALDNPKALELYAHSSIPLAHAAAVQLSAAYYGTEPQRSYFGGCSNGGRMGAIAAQRYPQLFNGIFAGGSVLNLSQNGGIFGSWVVQANSSPDGSRILTAENFAAKLPLLQAEVLAQCDSSDDRQDGNISQPRACEPDLPRLPACPNSAGGPDSPTNDTASCFTEAELGVLNRWYQGPQNTAGEQLYPGMPPGSERYWLVWFLDPPGQTAPGNALGGDYARYMGFPEGVPENYTALDFDFDHDPPRLAAQGELLNALDPDLDDFREAGGKLLMWHGWQDPLVLPDQSVAYYQQVETQAGGTAAAQDFVRLFMIPGQGHCWEMPAEQPDQFNPLFVLEQWAEQGKAPDTLLLTTPPAEAGSTARQGQSAVVCPYPIAANSCSR